MGREGIRSDIEGLRAVAVLLVVACHAGLPGFSGGYVGVDVFFVISGYLITHLLYREHQATGALDLAAFYGRRIRRLLPAFAVLVATVLAGIHVLASPLEQPALIRSVLAASLYISNLHFAWQSSDYWGPASKQDPLLHTWSLGVEEQFYLVWPLLLAMVLGGAAALRRFVIPGLMAASFGLALYWMAVAPPKAFFFPLARAWEFGVGAVLALYPATLQALRARLGAPYRRHLVEGAGLALILSAALLFDGDTRFPGIAALPPVLGAALVIAAGIPGAAGGGASLLGVRPLQWLGGQSYGWYLWHWPVLVFGLMLVPGASPWLKLLWVVVALLPAWLVHCLVEAPIRRRPGWARLRVALPMLVMLPAVILVAGLQLGERADTVRASPPYERLSASRGRVPPLYVQGCDRGLLDATVTACSGGAVDGRRLLVLVGDSHAGQWASAFDDVARRNGWRLLMYTKSACPMVDQPFVYAKLGRLYYECEAWRRDVTTSLASLRPDLVVLSNSEAYPFTPEQWEHGAQAIVAALAPASGRVVILRDSPLPGLDIPGCLARRLWQPRLYMDDCGFSTAGAHQAWIDAVHRRVTARVANATYLDLTPLLCPGDTCPVMDGDIVKYRDGNHLSDAYVRKLAPALEEMLRRQELL